MWPTFDNTHMFFNYVTVNFLTPFIFIIISVQTLSSNVVVNVAISAPILPK
jgi:hypothetical protein